MKTNLKKYYCLKCAILFEGASAEEFAPVFVWDGVQYFKKIK